jgi:hypothetical protein
LYFSLPVTAFFHAFQSVIAIVGITVRNDFPALLMCLSALTVLSMRFRFEQEYGQGKHIAYLLSGLLFAEAMLLLGSVFYSGRAAEQLVVENVLLCIQLVLAFSTMLLMLHQSNHASSGLTGSQPETQNRFKEVAGSEDRVACLKQYFNWFPIP